MPEGAEITGGDSTTSITVVFADTASSGNVEVAALNYCGEGPYSLLAVTVNEQPNAFAGNDTIIPFGTSTTLNASSGGSGTYSYLWSPDSLLIDPTVQNPQTIILEATALFSLVVTDEASLCTDSDEVIVTITGGPLSCNPAASPAEICKGEAVQLFANAGGGSGNYSYEWTSVPPGNPPWISTQANPLVTPDSTTIYLLDLYDGFTSALGGTRAEVFALPEATLSGSDTLCEEGDTGILQVDLTGIPPWTITWTNGLTTEVISGINTSPFFLEVTEPGTYEILSVSDENCENAGTGQGEIIQSKPPPDPEITINEMLLSSNAPLGNQWHLDGAAIPGATGQTYVAEENGIYYTIVTLEGCSSDTSNNIQVLTIGIDELGSSPFKIYPNPVRDFIRIVPKSDQIKYTYSLHAVDGRTMIPASETIGSESIRIYDLQTGLYLLRIVSEENSMTFLVICE
jgi:hypothetical protein